MTLPTSLQAIAKKAKDQTGYRLRNLSREVNEVLLRDSWRKLNKRSATGIDQVSYHDYDKRIYEDSSTPSIMII